MRSCLLQQWTTPEIGLHFPAKKWSTTARKDPKMERKQREENKVGNFLLFPLRAFWWKVPGGGKQGKSAKGGWWWWWQWCCNDTFSLSKETTTALPPAPFMLLIKSVKERIAEFFYSANEQETDWKQVEKSLAKGKFNNGKGKEGTGRLKWRSKQNEAQAHPLMTKLIIEDIAAMFTVFGCVWL